MRHALPCIALWLTVSLGASAEASRHSAMVAALAKQFDQHPLVMVGELHRYEQLHVFLRELISDARFICRADDIVVEFGNQRLQGLVDAYISGGEVSEAQLQSVWRETAVPLTWNSPVYQQFFATVREVNRKHLCKQSLRMLVGDPPLDWSKVGTKRDYQPLTDRDGSLAAVIEREVLAKHRRAFVLAGEAHAVKKGPQGSQDGPEQPNAAQLIERNHPGALFCIVPVPTTALGEALKLPAAPSLTLLRGSEQESADFGLLWKLKEGHWPAMPEVVDALLYLGGDATFLYPSPSIYLAPAYQRELRRRAGIIKDLTGQDFVTVIDGLVKEAEEAPRAPPPRF